jgi:hypothetical protein
MTTVALVKSLFPTGRRVLLDADILDLDEIDHVPFEGQVNRGQRRSGYNPKLPRRPNNSTDHSIIWLPRSIILCLRMSHTTCFKTARNSPRLLRALIFLATN